LGDSFVEVWFVSSNDTVFFLTDLLRGPFLAVVDGRPRVRGYLESVLDIFHRSSSWHLSGLATGKYQKEGFPHTPQILLQNFKISKLLEFK
jgi:hypothetical protein